MANEDIKHDVPALHTGTDGDSSDEPAGALSTSQGDSLVITINRDTIVPLVLSAGIVVALLVFTIEMFEHPNEANILIPLLAAPVGTLLVNLLRCKHCRRGHKEDAAE